MQINASASAKALGVDTNVPIVHSQTMTASLAIWTNLAAVVQVASLLSLAAFVTSVV